MVLGRAALFRSAAAVWLGMQGGRLLRAAAGAGEGVAGGASAGTVHVITQNTLAMYAP